MTGGKFPADAQSVPLPRETGRPYRICLVCMGNICRSPMAEAVVRAEAERAGLADLLEVDSAGLGDWHVGERIDPRAGAELARHGYGVGGHRARQIRPSWLGDRDLILAMDKHNFRGLRRMGEDVADLPGRLRLFRSYDPAAPYGAEVPDPYLGDGQSFAHVLALIEPAAKELIAGVAHLLAR